MRTRLCALLALALSGTAESAIVVDLSYVNPTGPAYTRFRNWVDQAVAGNPGYAFSATDAAYAYRISGGNQYCQLAVQMVEADVVAAEAEIAAGRRPPVSYDSYLEVGQYIRDLSITYDWCAAFTTAAQRTRWANYAQQAVWNVWNYNQATWGGTAFPWSGWSVNDPGNNYHYSFLEATMYWSLASNNSTWRTFLEQQKLPPLVAYFAALPGGGSAEGTAYGLSHARLFELYRVWRDNTGTNLAAQSAHLEDSIDWWVHATVPTLDAVAPIGDQARVSYPEMYDYHRNLVLQARAMATDPARRARAGWWLASISVPQMASGFNFRNDLLSTASGGSAAPTATWYHATGTGGLFARTDWSPSAMWISFMAGPYNQSHAHQDQGSFNLFFDGEFRAVTENVWSHSGLQQDTNAHNLVRFVQNGTTVRQFEGTTSTMTVTPVAGGISVDANLTSAFNGNAAVTNWRRQLMFANRKLTVHDTFATAPNVQAVFQVNVPVAPVVNGRNASAGPLSIRVLQPADATIAVLDWHAVDANEFNSGYRLDVRGTGSEFLVELGEAGLLFANGFE
ncbi:MAG TPA: heparinase II/III family protein [Xanthomonadales bacterium]|nr:heparinase II/III family protein [Xanthomonadales bacterium]